MFRWSDKSILMRNKNESSIEGVKTKRGSMKRKQIKTAHPRSFNNIIR